MDGLVTFMNRLGGRALRIVLGLVLVGWGWLAASTVGTIAGLIGVVPLVMGLWGHCLLEPFGSKGPKTRGA